MNKDLPKYHFEKIPNNDDGRNMITALKMFLGPRYKLRVRGQHLKDGENWRDHPYGQPLSKSKYLRVYIEEK